MKHIIALACALFLSSADHVFAQQPAPQPPHPNADFTVRVIENKLPSQVTLQWHNQDVVVLCRVRGNGQNLEVLSTSDNVQSVKDPVLDRNVSSPGDGFYYAIYRFRATKDGDGKIEIKVDGKVIGTLPVSVKFGSHRP
ncbi:MAG: hypothetical protein K2W82_10615 [Candidatus Obscuribacterales bacterium]|nr:hypothetical protein [Candidatus Obscuribacterales bacterium]